MDALGIDTADIGLPGAGPRVAADVEQLAKAIGDLHLAIRPNRAGANVNRERRMTQLRTPNLSPASNLLNGPRVHHPVPFGSIRRDGRSTT